MFKSDWLVTFATGKELSAVALGETASMCTGVRAWFSVQGSTKPFLSSLVLNFSWDQMFIQKDVNQTATTPGAAALCTFDPSTLS